MGNDIVLIRGRLAVLGWPSLSAWARAHGFQGVTAAYAIRTWGHRTDREPHGGSCRALLRDLRHTLDTQRRPTPEDLRA